jgi:hypothetical protein
MDDEQIFWSPEHAFGDYGGEGETELHETEYFRDSNSSIYDGYELLVPPSEFISASEFRGTKDETDEETPNILGLGDSGSLARSGPRDTRHVQLVECKIVKVEPPMQITEPLAVSISIVNNDSKPFSGPFLMKIKPNAFGLRPAWERILNKMTYVFPKEIFTFTTGVLIDMTQIDPSLVEKIPVVSYHDFLIIFFAPNFCS